MAVRYKMNEPNEQFNEIYILKRKRVNVYLLFKASYFPYNFVLRLFKLSEKVV